jgi:hypothetical protein
MAVLAGSPIPMAPFLVLLSYVRRALRRTQSSLVPNRAVNVAERVCSITHLRLTPKNSATEEASKNAEDFGGRLSRRALPPPGARGREDASGPSKSAAESSGVIL